MNNFFPLNHNAQRVFNIILIPYIRNNEFFGNILAESLIAIIAIIWFKKGKWKEIKVYSIQNQFLKNSQNSKDRLVFFQI